MNSLTSLLEDTIKLPSPPSIALRLLESLKKDDSSFTEIAAIIRSDPALAAKVLRMVNSSFYSLPHKIGSIDRALSILGVHAMKNIALSFILIECFTMQTGIAFDMNYFWRRSLISALCAELFSNYLNIKDDDIFITALLQDIGILILSCDNPDEYTKLIGEKNTTRIPLDILETRTFGFAHQELGSEVLDRWKLPENIFVPIKYHHAYREAPEQYRQMSRILYLSHALSSILCDTESIEKIRHFSKIIKDDLEITDSVLESLADGVAERILETCSLFEIPAGTVRHVTRLLQEANEGLSDLNLSYEKLLIEYKKKKNQAEKLARQLKEANDKLQEANGKLQEMSILDYLTGLYNRRYLFDYLDKELERARRYGECFSLLMFDVDHFKKINDTYGHNFGDIVLKAIGDAAGRIRRSTDVLARYGGEEFVVVLPQTDRKGAVTIAERLRKGIAGLDISADGRTLKITVSIGVAAYGPGSGEMTVGTLIEKADQALYLAKYSGRNKVAAPDPGSRSAP